MTEPRDGDTRNEATRTVHGQLVKMVNSSTGEPVYAGPIWSCTTPVGERYCAVHGWQPYQGIIDTIIGCRLCAPPPEPGL